jgi:acyl-CoA synthetase (AMP-forming)/AMP-acid ligase II
MMKGYEDRTRDFDVVWRELAACRHKGIHVCNETTGEVELRSFAEYVEHAVRLAGVLMRHGITARDKVLVCAETTADFPALWLALVWIGATPVPMPPSYALMGQYTFRERVKGILGYFHHYCCRPEELESLSAIATEISATITLLPIPELLQEARQFAGAPPPRVTLSEQALAFVQFTSGSTRAPKGVQITYRNLFANVAAIWSRLQFDTDRHRWISWLPLYHDMGLVCLLASFVTQSGLILMSPQHFARRPLQFLTLAHEYHASYCSMPNFAYEWIMKRMQGRSNLALALDNFVWMGVGAEPVNPTALTLFQQLMAPYGLRSRVLSPCYGLAEATLGVSLAAPGEGYRLHTSSGETRVTCGRPLEGLDIDLSENRIRIRGDCVARTALVDGQEVLLADADGYYDTKDLGLRDGHDLVVLGRAEEMFVVNGHNYFPYAIESVVRDVEAVLKRRVICFQARSQPDSGTGLVLLYETLPIDADVAGLVEGSIRSHVLKHTGLEPEVVLGVLPRSIPVTPSGKLQRLRARQMFLDGYFQPARPKWSPQATVF